MVVGNLRGKVYQVAEDYAHGASGIKKIFFGFLFLISVRTSKLTHGTIARMSHSLGIYLTRKREL